MLASSALQAHHKKAIQVVLAGDGFNPTRRRDISRSWASCLRGKNLPVGTLAEEIVDDRAILLPVQGTGGVIEDTARPYPRCRLGEKFALERSQGGNLLGSLPPAQIRPLVERPQTRTRYVAQDAIDTVRKL